MLKSAMQALGLTGLHMDSANISDMDTSILEKNIELENGVNYFFCLLGPRFQQIVDDLCKKLENRHGQQFVPIYVSESSPLDRTVQYIHLDVQTEHPQDRFYAEELNIAFSDSKYVEKLATRLLAKQKQFFLISFTSAFLSGHTNRLSIIGPDPTVATKYDNKVEQAHLYDELSIRHPVVYTFETYDDLVKQEIEYPCYISAAYTSSGVESSIIRNKNELHIFYERLRPINKRMGFCVSRIVDYDLAPNISAIALPDGNVQIVTLTDQVLLGNSHIGNIFPSRILQEHKTQIYKSTTKIGKHLSDQGFYGLFGCDFLIDKKEGPLIIDLNPRRQGGYLPNYLSATTDILDIELDIQQNIKMKYSSKETLEPDYSWVQSKIATSKKIDVTKKYRKGNAKDPFEKIGSYYAQTYFDSGSGPINYKALGTYIATNKDKADLMKEMDKNTKYILEEISSSVG